MINSKTQNHDPTKSHSLDTNICTRTSNLHDTFKFDRKLTDARFGDVMLLQDPNTGQCICYKERRVSEETEVGKLASAAEAALQHKHQYVSGLIDYAVSKNAEVWSNHFTVRLYYEYTRWSLKDEIRKRFKLGDKFCGEELTHMLYQMIEAHIFLKEKEGMLPILTPQRIAYNKEKLETKLVHDPMDKTTGHVPREQHKRLIAGHNLYVSPAMFDLLKRERLDFGVNIEKEVVFALGLIILEAGVGRPIQDIYNNQSKRFVKMGLKGHIKAFKSRLWESSTLCGALRSMLSIDEQKRPTFEQLKASIPQYEEAKRQMEEGNIEEDEGELEHNIWEARHTSSDLEQEQKHMPVPPIATNPRRPSLLHDIVDSKMNYTNLLSIVNKQLKEETDKTARSHVATSKCFSAIKVNSSVITPKKEVARQPVKVFRSDSKPDQQTATVRPVALFANQNKLDEYGYSKPEQRKKQSDYPTNVYYCNMFANDGKRPTEPHRPAPPPQDNEKKYNSAKHIKIVAPVPHVPTPSPFNPNACKQVAQPRSNSSAPYIMRGAMFNNNETVNMVAPKKQELQVLTHNINKNNIKYINSTATGNSPAPNVTMRNTKPLLSSAQKGLLASVHHDVFKPDGNIRHIHLKENSIVEPKVIRSYSVQSLVRSTPVPNIPRNVNVQHPLHTPIPRKNIARNDDLQVFMQQDFKSYNSGSQNGVRMTNMTSRSVSVNTNFVNGTERSRNAEGQRGESVESIRGVRVVERTSGSRPVEQRVQLGNGYGLMNFSEYG